MDRGLVALLWIIVFLFLAVLIFSIDWTPDAAVVEAEPVVAGPAIVINNPENVVVSDREAVSDTVPVTTVSTEATTQNGPIVVARAVAPGGCTGVCATACPGTVISGMCPVGTICCV